MSDAIQRQKLREVRIRRVPDKTNEELRNIADHMGISITDLLKPELARWVAAQPEYMRRPRQQ